MRLLIPALMLIVLTVVPAAATGEIPQVIVKGLPFALAGPLPAIDTPAPVFIARDRELSPWTFAPADGKIRLLITVPSLDSAICNLEVKKFFKQTTDLSDSLEVIVISMDLPHAQRRWCVENQAKRLLTLSDHVTGDFGSRYGVLIPTIRLLARAIFVLDGQGIIRYRELVPELGQEPDYDSAMRSVRNLLGLPLDAQSQEEKK